MKPLSYEQALNKAASLCSSSEHASTEIHEKLLRWGLSATDAAKAIDYLIDEKYIDDERFCKAYSRDKVRYNRWGRVKIQQMLRMMHLADCDIRAGLQAIEPEIYEQALRESIQQKDRTLHETDDYTRRGKLIRYLLSHGFEMDAIRQTLNLEL